MTKATRSIRGIAILCLTATSAAHAGDAVWPPSSTSPLILIPQAVPYADGVGNEAIRAECDFPTALPQQIVKQAPEYKLPVQVSADDLSADKGRVLLIRTILVHSIGGAGWTGPKWARIHLELRDAGKVIASTELEQNTSGHSFGFSACGVLREIAEFLAADVLSWLRTPGLTPGGAPMAIAAPFPLANKALWDTGQWSETSVLSDLKTHRFDGLAIAEMQMRGTLRDSGATLSIEVRGKIDAAKGHDRLADLKLEFLDGDSVVATAGLPNIKAPEEEISKFKGQFSIPAAVVSASPATTLRITISDRAD